MTLPADILKDLEAFKQALPKVTVKKKVRRMKREGPTVTHEGPALSKEPRPQAETTTPNVRRNGAKSWLVMVPTGAAMRGLKSREDPVVRDSPITRAPYEVAHMTGVTARICNDAGLFKRTR